MKNNHPFHRFIELINFDQAVHALLAAQAKLTQDMSEIKQQLALQEDVYAKSQRVALEARKAVDAMELEMKELGQKENVTKKKFDQMTSYKETPGLQREIDQLRAQQHELEDSLLQAWHSLEMADREKSEQKKKYDEKKIQVQAALEKNQSERIAVDAELTAHEAQREEKKKDIPEEWLLKYAAMRLRVTNPVVPVEGDSCSACFHELSHQETMRLARGALLECKVCFRFLYHKNILNAS